MTPIHRKGDPIQHTPPSAVFQNTAEAASTTANQRRPCPDRQRHDATVRFRSGNTVKPRPAQNRTTTGNPAATHGFPVGASAETTAALIENA